MNYEINSPVDAFLALKEDDNEMPKKRKRFSEARDYNLTGLSDEEIADAKDFIDKAKDDSQIEVIDPDADVIEHIKNKEDYVGQAILRCNKCKSYRFIELDKLEVDPDDAENYNLEDECPHCHTEGDGYELVGQVGKVEPEDIESEDEENNAGEDITIPPEEEPEEEIDDSTDFDFSFDDLGTDNEIDFNDNEEVDLDAPADDEAVDNEDEAEMSDEEALKALKAADDEEVEFEVEDDKKEEGLETYTSEDDDEMIEEDFDEDDADEDSSITIIYNDPDWVVVQVDELAGIQKYAKDADWTFCQEDGERYWNAYHDEKDVKLFIYFDKHSNQKYLVGLWPVGEVSGFDVNNSEVDVTKLGAPDIKEILSDDKAASLDEILSETPHAKDAMNMNSIISNMNAPEAAKNEAWQHTWTKGILQEGLNDHDFDCKCACGFENDADFDELANLFYDLYVQFHDRGLKSCCKKSAADFAHKIDRDLDIAPIAIVKDAPAKKATHSIDINTVEDILSDVATPENIDKVIICNNVNGVENTLFEGSVEDIPFNFSSQPVCVIDTLRAPFACYIDTAAGNRTRTSLKQVLRKLNNSCQVSLQDDNTNGELFVGNKADAIKQYGDCACLGFETPSFIKFTIKDSTAPSMLAKKANSDEENLLQQIFIANDLLPVKADKVNSEEYWIKESIMNNEDLDDLYEQYIRPQGTHLIKLFGKVTGYQNEHDMIFNEGYEKAKYELSLEKKINAKKEHVNEKRVAVRRKLINEKKAKQSSIRSFKTRRELSKAINECKNNNRPYTISRSLKEGYRYDLTEENDQSSDLSTTVLLQVIQAANNIKNAFKKVFNEDVPVGAFAADLLQDLGLISGRIKIDDIPDSQLNQLSKEMYRRQSADLDEVEKSLSEIFGTDLTTTNEQRFQRALQILASPAFSQENIEQGFRSDIMRAALEDGELDYIDPDELDYPEVDPLEDSDYGEFDESLNEADEEDFEMEIIPKERAHHPQAVGKFDRRAAKEFNTSTGVSKRSPQEEKLFLRLGEVAKNTADAIKEIWGVDANAAAIVADLFQDLRIVSGNIKIDDLPDTLTNRATKALYGEYNQFYDLCDQVLSVLTGENIQSTPEKKFIDAYNLINSPVFNRDAIFNAIGSPKFKTMLDAGMVPYAALDSAEEPAAIELPNRAAEPIELSADDVVDFDEKAFDEDLNEYFDQAYKDTVLFESKKGTINRKGEIMVEGVITNAEIETPVTFTLKPKQAIKENLSINQLKKSIKGTEYIVTNNVSDEVFSYKVDSGK